MSSPLKGEITVREPTPVQRAFARRAAEAKATVPEITLDVDVEIDAVMALASGLIGAPEEPRLQDFIIKACGVALREFPTVNASYRDGRYELYSRVNIGITIPGQRSVVVPTILDADRKTLIEIAAQTRDFADRVEEGSISAGDLAGATFTVAVIGVEGIARFQSVISPPQAASLAVASPRTATLIEDGRAGERQIVTLAMSCDHRILYGADAGAFLSRLRALLAAPKEWCGE
jgi:pyruvate dehydrogenase E2 component (dihydrolipoamide acetyltransferase)